MPKPVQLIFRLDHATAAAYRTLLSREGCSMQRDLERYVAQRLDSSKPASEAELDSKPVGVQREPDALTPEQAHVLAVTLAVFAEQGIAIT
jgi:hypothetical protein